MKRLFLFVVAVITAASVSAQFNPMQPIEADKDVRVGKLENGMTYYIRHNEKPKGQAHFYILHDVGAIQEDDNQQGLAHFLEHMAFNGTKNLPGKQLINYLESIGVKFGYNLNAGTSWDYTEYQLRDVPTTRKEIVDSALLVLHDWSHFIALKPAEIDSERGVIQEELRTRDGASWRSTINMIKTVARGTKYEHRNLIGHLDGLQGFSHSDLESFYRKWYRPELQAVVVVGDIDVDYIENHLKSLMSDIPASPADAAQKEVITVPDNEEPIISIFTDPEMKSSNVRYIFKRGNLVPKPYANTIYAEMMQIISMMMTHMGNARLSEIAMKPDAPFTGAGMSNGSFGICPTFESFSAIAQSQDGKLPAAFEAICTEVERIRRHGFTPGEFERAQNNLLRSCERAYNNRNDRKNGEYVQIYLSNFRENSPMPDAKTEWQLDSMIIKNLNVDVVNQLASKLITPTNQIVIANAPEREGLVNPTEAEILSIMQKVAAAEIAPYEDNVVKEPLIGEDVELKGSPVVKTKTNKTLGTIEWTLANGTRVIVKHSTLKADEVMMKAYTEGGFSLLSDEDYYSGMFIPSVVAMSGVSKFSQTDLRKQLSGKSASVYLNGGEYDHGFSGNCSPKDLETMLQLLYLTVTAPRFNETDFNVMMKQYRSYVDNLKTNPDFIASREEEKTLYGNHLRRQSLSMELLDKVNFERMDEIFEKLFSKGNVYTYTFVGNVEPETLRPLVEKYIGSLPAAKKGLSFVDDGVRYAKGEVVNDFKAPMQQPKVSVARIFTGKAPATLKNRLAMSFLTQALNSRYLISIREEKGGTYGVRVSGGFEDLPFETYKLRIQFDTNEQQADELSEIVMTELKKIAAEGPLAEDIEKTREFYIKEWHNTLEQNGGWMRAIRTWYENGIDQLGTYESIIKNMKYSDIQKLAQKILKDNNMTYVVMRPEAK